MNIDLLTRFIETYPAQPATAFWRGIEVQALIERWSPEGLGLDLGCGDAKLTKIIADEMGGLDMIGIDPDPLETEAAVASGFYREVHTVGGDAVPVDDATFDYVLSNSVLEHIPPLEPVIAETGRVLKPGGEFVFSVPTTGFRTNLAGPSLPFADREKYLDTLDKRLAHFHYLSQADWAEMLGRHGMQIETCFGYLDRRECRRWETMSRYTGGLLYSLGGGRKRPIEVQRKLGLRDLQNKRSLPRGLARTIAKTISVGHRKTPVYWSTDAGLADHEAGCLLIKARRV